MSQDLLKPWKYLLFPPTRSFADAFTMFIKCVLLFSAVASMSLFCFAFFSNYTRLSICSDDCTHQHSYLRFKTSSNNYHTTTTLRSPPDDEQQQPTNISHILFGLGGSAKTWNERRRYSEIWWKPNVTRGYMWLDREPGKEDGGTPSNSNSPEYRVSEDTSRFKYTCGYGSRAAIRIARIVKESFELGLDNVRWFVMGDDDTVFFTENLVTVLSKYDHNQMYYIGGISESVEQDVIHSYTMGFGGGGFAVSYPLASELVRVLDGCIDRYASTYGSDQKIGGCMMEIGVPITRELGFHQLDLRGSSYGLLAAHPLAPLVSLHHLDYMQPLFPDTGRVDSVKRLVESYKADPSRALQHSICYDLKRNWSISVAWGYTAQIYPSLLTAKDLATPVQTFLTWRTWSREPFTFNTRVQSLEPCERPLVYYFDDVKVIDNGTLTSYKRPDDTRKQCDRDFYSHALSIQRLNVSAAFLHPDVWKKAPRRQCCEVMDGGDVGGVLQVRIRGCRQWESVTPH